MPRPAAEASIDSIIRSTIAETMKIASAAIAQVVSDMAVEQLGRELESAVGAATSRSAPSRGRRKRARGEMVKWVADNRARRVPTFVIEQTGLATKKEIVAKFGPGVVFEKGKALPAKAK
jgi:sulfite reductase beta subunit-like hemoprotein